MPKLIVSLFIGVLLLFECGQALSQSIPPSRLDPRSPVVTPYLHIFSCYDIITGNKLDCQVYDELVGVVSSSGNPLVNAGFHAAHQGSHPLVDKSTGASGFFCLLCTDFNQDPLIVQTKTNSASAVVFHSVPQFAGRVQVKATITPPPGWSCLTDCNFDFVEEVGVDGLSELEVIGVNHQIIRDGTSTHPIGASGTSDALNRVRVFAHAYKTTTNNGLSVNDLSLPRGGKFDLHNAYDEADKEHIEHRRGTDFDINSQDLGGQNINCLLHNDLQTALKKLGVRKKVCHSTGAYHVGF